MGGWERGLSGVGGGRRHSGKRLAPLPVAGNSLSRDVSDHGDDEVAAREPGCSSA